MLIFSTWADCHLLLLRGDSTKKKTRKNVRLPKNSYQSFDWAYSLAGQERLWNSMCTPPTHTLPESYQATCPYRGGGGNFPGWPFWLSNLSSCWWVQGSLPKSQAQWLWGSASKGLIDMRKITLTVRKYPINPHANAYWVHSKKHT